MEDSFEEILKWMKEISGRLDQMNRNIQRLFNTKDCLDGDELLDNQDLCLLLGVTKRTLRRYRQKNIIKCYLVDKQKMYYKKSEINDFLKQKGKSGI